MMNSVTSNNNKRKITKARHDVGGGDFQCCGQEDKFLEAEPLRCYLDQAFINSREKYYSIEDKGQSRLIIICEDCFQGNRGYGVVLVNKRIVPESKVKAAINEPKRKEDTVTCSKCNNRFNQVCVIHSPEVFDNFICKDCNKSNNNKQMKKMNPFSSSDLPHCPLSKYMEEHLKKMTMMDEMIIVRVLLTEDKVLYFKPNFKRKYGRLVPGGNVNNRKGIPYKERTVYAFRRLKDEDGSGEVAFFAFITQEFYGNCDYVPNRGNIYLSYLDSINIPFFNYNNKKEGLNQMKVRRKSVGRTELYHQILLGYFDYMRTLGFRNLFLWVCPTNQFTGRDYIFHSRPLSMEHPDEAKLQRWYKHLFEKAVGMGIAKEHQTLFQYIHTESQDHSSSSSTISIWNFPYFEGDEWPYVFEELIDKEKELPTADNLKRKRKSASGNFKSFDFDTVTANALEEMYLVQDSFLVLRFLSGNCDDELLPMVDNINSSSGLPTNFPSREDFKQICMEKGYQFSTIQHCKRSTTFLLYLAFPSCKQKSSFPFSSKKIRSRNNKGRRPGGGRIRYDTTEEEDDDEFFGYLSHVFHEDETNKDCVVCEDMKKLMSHFLKDTKGGGSCMCQLCEIVSSIINKHLEICRRKSNKRIRGGRDYMCPYEYCPNFHQSNLQ